MFGTPIVTTYIYGIPSPSQPNLFIAPWCEDLDPAKGGPSVTSFLAPRPTATGWHSGRMSLFTPTRPTFATSRRSFTRAARSSSSMAQYRNGRDGGDWLGECQWHPRQGWTGAITNGMALLFSAQPGSADSDQDGLPDAWETFCFGNLACCGADDSDSDGLCNLGEFRAGTDPTQAASQLRIGRVPPPLADAGTPPLAKHPGKPYTVWLEAPPVTQPKLSLGSARAGIPPRIHIEAEPVLPYVLSSASNLCDWIPLHHQCGRRTDGFRGCSGHQSSLPVLPRLRVVAKRLDQTDRHACRRSPRGTNYYTNAFLPAAGMLRLSTP